MSGEKWGGRRRTHSQAILDCVQMGDQLVIRIYSEMTSVGKIVKRCKLSAQFLIGCPGCVRHFVRVVLPSLKTPPDIFFGAPTLDKKKWNLALTCEFHKSPAMCVVRKRCVNDNPITARQRLLGVCPKACIGLLGHLFGIGTGSIVVRGALRWRNTKETFACDIGTQHCKPGPCRQ